MVLRMLTHTAHRDSLCGFILGGKLYEAVDAAGQAALAQEPWE